MIATATTGVSTSGPGNVTLLSSAAGGYARATIINEGSVAGFFSLDGGSTWGRIPAAAAATSPVVLSIPLADEAFTITIIRDPAASSDMSGVYAFAL